MRARTWWAMVAAGFYRQSAYRLAMLAGLVANVAFGLIRSAQLSAASDSVGGTRAGYEQDQLMGFVWLSQGLLGAVNLFGATEIAGTQVVGVEADGARQKLAFDAATTTAASVLAEVGARAEVRDLAIEEPDADDVVRRLYERQR
ncbi:hypothetical protein ACFFHC_09685 [Kytococcus schroeteri]|nr:hypothetical protein [Kytococcus schroeteri]